MTLSGVGKDGLESVVRVLRALPVGECAMMWRGLFVCVLLAGCPSESSDEAGGSASREVPGVLGLEWGAKERDVRKVLEDKFGLVKRTESVADALIKLQTGGGTFEGMSVESVQAELACGELRKFEIVPAKDQRSIFRRWKALVASVAHTYGAPNSQVEPPAAATATIDPPHLTGAASSPQSTSLLKIDQAAQEAVTRDVQEGRGKLMASWDFAHARGARVAARAGEGDQFGHVILEWSMFDFGSEEHDCEEHHPDLVRLKDF